MPRCVLTTFASYSRTGTEGMGSALRRIFREAQGEIGNIQDADLEYDQGDCYNLIAPIEPIALQLLDVYSVQSCLLERNEALGTLLAASRQRQKVYADDQSVLFVRSVDP
jgi:hypothetical protein